MKNLYSSPENGGNPDLRDEIGTTQTPSLIRTLFHTIVVKEGNKMFLAVGVLTVLITIADNIIG